MALNKQTETMTDSLAHTHTHRMSRSQEALWINRKQHSVSRSVSHVPEGTVHLNQVPSSVYLFLLTGSLSYLFGCFLLVPEVNTFLWTARLSSDFTTRFWRPDVIKEAQNIKRRKSDGVQCVWCIVLNACWFGLLLFLEPQRALPHIKCIQL